MHYGGDCRILFLIRKNGSCTAKLTLVYLLQNGYKEENEPESNGFG